MQKEIESVALRCDYFPCLRGREYRVVDRGYDHFVVRCKGRCIRVPFWAIQGMDA